MFNPIPRGFSESSIVYFYQHFIPTGLFIEIKLNVDLKDIEIK